MSTKKRAAWISVAVVAVITITKFTFFLLSGSAAVLSESWHGFSDLLTSSIVLFFIYRSKKQRIIKNVPREQPSPTRIFKLFLNIDSENKAALLISTLLFIISISIFLNILLYPAAIKVSFPLETGITFVFLSIGSYFLYHFQSSLGRSVKSAAIVADGMHSKADMVIALMTALSLFLYYFNVNVDRYIGLVTSVYIFVTAVEMMTNTILSIKGDSTHISLLKILMSTWSYTTSHLLHTSLLTPWRRYKKPILTIVLLSLLVGYGSTAFYTVDTERSAILLRIGKVVNKTEPISPGLHLKYPWPIDRVISYTSEVIYSLAIANTTQPDSALLWSVEHGDDQYFISGDNNFFMPYIVVNYKIKDVYTYHTFNKRPYKLLEKITMSYITRIFASNSFYNIAVFQRKEWASTAKKEIQKKLDNLNSGIQIVNFILKDIHPPISIAKSYEAVIASYQKQKELTNSAQQYAFVHTSASLGKAHAITTEANTFAFTATHQAEGSVARYLGKLASYKTAPKLIKRLLFLESATKSLTTSEKIVFDKKTGLTRQFLYNEKFLFKGSIKK